jgi:hypothetical protein
MARLINGALTVGAFVPTGNPGEYTFENALFNNQADATGSGAYDVQAGFALFVPASDTNTFMPVPGLVHRYKLTTVTVVDVNTISGTLLWDELGDEVDAPTNGVACLLAETTADKRLAIPAVDASYPDIPAGTTLAALLNDQRNIVEHITAGAGAGARKQESLPVTSDGQTTLTLSETPKDPSDVVLTVNGLRYANGPGKDFTVADKTVTWSDLSLTLETTDGVVVDYAY